MVVRESLLVRLGRMTVGDRLMFAIGAMLLLLAVLALSLVGPATDTGRSTPPPGLVLQVQLLELGLVASSVSLAIAFAGLPLVPRLIPVLLGMGGLVTGVLLFTLTAVTFRSPATSAGVGVSFPYSLQAGLLLSWGLEAMALGIGGLALPLIAARRSARAGTA